MELRKLGSLPSQECCVARINKISLNLLSSNLNPLWDNLIQAQSRSSKGLVLQPIEQKK
ncbi:hypothetical protein M595_0522 [Lyngbya aestuarii BL J]|uniref:Uncharacterized protein n=1 Tax=Lyngbya aestuarii BL J TaxID=1348334 RepID=U7QQV4_9CYAN|nr:hypothetical protein M595_0522 [Lyngbya aestuarii BL J]